MLMCALVFEWC